MAACMSPVNSFLVGTVPHALIIHHVEYGADDLSVFRLPQYRTVGSGA